MSRIPDANAVLLLTCALAAQGLLSGCASIWGKDKESVDSFASRPADPSGKYGVRPASAEEPEEKKSLDWSDFSWDNLGKTTKKLTGRGEDRKQAQQLYREACDLFNQAKTADPRRRADIYEMAAPKFAAAADRWPDSQ